MSTILKALRRLEEEKSRGVSSRPLREEVASGPREAPRRRLSWFPVLAALVGVALGGSAWWFWPYERGGEPVREAASAAPAAVPAPDPVTAVTPLEPTVETHVTRRVPPGFNAAAAQVEEQLAMLAEQGAAEEPEAGPPEEALGDPPEDAFASGVEVVDRPQPTPRIEPVPQGRQPERVIANPLNLALEPPAVTARRPKQPRVPDAAPAPPPRVAAAPAPDPVTAPAPDPVTAPAPPEPRAAASTPVEQPAPQVRDPAPARVAPKSAPVAGSKSSDEASAVRVKRTQWHPEASRRSADLDVSGRSQNVREGDLVDDYVVTEIRPSGIVLTRDGERFERGIGK